MSKAAAITIAIIASVFVGFLVILAITSSNSTIDFSVFDTSRPISGNEHNGNIADHVRGLDTAKVFIVEFADFSCPMCGEVSPIMQQYIEDKSGDVAIIFRNYPVQSAHPNSIAAASAAEAAGLIKKSASSLEDQETQDKLTKGLIDDTYYFEMADTLFKNRTVWQSVDASIRTNTLADLFGRIAPEANIDEFLAHMSSQTVKDKVNFDLALGRFQGITGTPSFFLDNKKLTIGNMTDIDSVLKPAVEAKLKQD